MSKAIDKNKKANSNKNYTTPEYEKTAFHCPHCNICSRQEWLSVYIYNIPVVIDELRIFLLEQYHKQFLTEHLVRVILNDLSRIYEHKSHIQNNRLSFCNHCKKYSIWVNQKMVYPHLSTAPLPTAEMPESVQELYNEARAISNQSPRGACALLRLAIEFLVKELGEDKSDLNTAIGNLVKKGLPEKIQQSLDAVRVIGNNAVHPGEINIKDNPEIAGSLFMLVNFISEKMITEDKAVDAIYSSLPKSKIEAINKRDSRSDNKKSNDN